MFRRLALATVIVACAPEPASLVFVTPPPATIITTSALPLPQVSVLDAKGNPISVASAAFETDPPGAALIEDGALVALRNGEIELVARVGKLEKRAKIDVRLVDRVEIVCPESPCELSVGDHVELKAVLFSGGAPVLPPSPLAWKVSQPAVMTPTGPGQFTASLAGDCRVEVAVGNLVGKLDVSVAGKLDRLKVACPASFSERGKDGGLECKLRQGKDVRLEVSASGGGQPITRFSPRWSSSDAEIASVTPDGRVSAIGIGRAEIAATVADVSGSIPLEVVPGCFGEWVEYELGREETPVYCMGRSALHCLNRKLENKDRAPSPEVLDECCCTLNSPEPPDDEGRYSGGRRRRR